MFSSKTSNSQSLKEGAIKLKKKIAIGINDFKTFILEGYYYVDKSLFIKEIDEDDSEVIVFYIPNGFGKTLNMSMLKYFYERTEENNRTLFKGLMIEQYKEIMEQQGKYIVIYIFLLKRYIYIQF